MYLSLCYFFIGLGFIIRISVGHQVRSRVAEPLAAVSFGSVFISDPACCDSLIRIKFFPSVKSEFASTRPGSKTLVRNIISSIVSDLGRYWPDPDLCQEIFSSGISIYDSVLRVQLLPLHLWYGNNDTKSTKFRSNFITFNIKYG